MDIGKDENNVTIHEKLDMLLKYQKQSMKFLTNVPSGEYDCTGLDGWQNLTTQDFIVETVSGSTGNYTLNTEDTSYVANLQFTMVKSYNETTGKLTISIGSSMYFDGSVAANVSLKANVYVL